MAKVIFDMENVFLTEWSTINKEKVDVKKWPLQLYIWRGESFSDHARSHIGGSPGSLQI